MEQKKLNIVRLVVLSVGGQKELAKREICRTTNCVAYVFVLKYNK